LIPNPGHPPPTTTTSKSGVVYYHRDRRGDVVATTANGGLMGVSYRYLPSGQLDKILDANGNPLAAGSEDQIVASELGFIGGLKLSGGLIHLKARVYSPVLRRFLQPDTIDFRRYTYAHGDPLNYSDPSGRKDDEKDGEATATHSDQPKTPPPPPPDPQKGSGGEDIDVKGFRDPNNWSSSCDYGSCSVAKGPFLPPMPGPSIVERGPIRVRLQTRRTTTETMRRLGYAAGVVAVCIGGACEIGAVVGGVLLTAAIVYSAADLLDGWLHAHADGAKASAYPGSTYPGADPSVSPGEGWEWRGPAGKGSWYNPQTGESLHPDLEHPDPIGPHWDYRDPNGKDRRIFPDGTSGPK
jgi:RHS repeat-associated protein